jgi:SPP1 gp7 family putative phage head morphogenesis protein
MVSRRTLEQIRARNTLKNGKLKKLKKPPKWLLPFSAERRYTAQLYEYTFQIRRLISQQILPKLPSWLVGSTYTYPDPVLPSQEEIEENRIAANLDSIIDDIISDLNDTLLIIDQILAPYQARAIADAARIGVEISIFNSIQFDKVTNSVLGVDIFQDEPWLETQLELFANQNSQLITNMTTNEIERVSGIVQRALQEGSSLESITDNIEKSFGITRRHAKLIARDQTTKLNGSLTKLRQQEIGVTQYRWETSNDERVRADHRVMQGKICRWDDPTVYLNEKTGKWEKRSTIGGTLVHTSQDVNCRCQPIAILEGVFANGN